MKLFVFRNGLSIDRKKESVVIKLFLCKVISGSYNNQPLNEFYAMFTNKVDACKKAN